jgi:hypothetical protein
MGAFGGDCSLEGGGDARPPAPLPLDGSLVVSPKARAKNRWLGLRTRPHLLCGSLPPPAPNQ